MEESSTDKSINADTMDSLNSGSNGGGDGFSSNDTNGSSSNPSARAGHGTCRDDVAVIAEMENAAVRASKIFVILVLVISTITVAMLTFYYLTNSENETFQTNFDDDVEKIFESLGSKLDLVMGDLDAYVVSVVSSVRSSSDMEWPLVSIPDHGVRVAKVRDLAQALVIEQYHIVEEDDRGRWEEFSRENAGWVEKNRKTQSADETFHGRTNFVAHAESYSIVGDDMQPVPSAESGFYAPSWQSYPIVPISRPPFNIDIFNDSSYHDSIEKLLKSRRVVMSEVINLAETVESDDIDDPSSYMIDEINSWASKYMKAGDDTNGEPLVRILYPVLTNAADSVSIDEYETGGDDPTGDANNSLVAVVVMTMQWRTFFEQILPAGEKGLHIVVENTCGQTFTYEINGPETVYLGPGDQHEIAYDGEKEEHATIQELRRDFDRKKFYTGLPLDEEYCSYTFRAYASDKMAGKYLSEEPVAFTFVVVAIFVFTAMVFILYDYLVGIRQNKVMKSAVQSNAIVSSLFPRNVRERLFRAEEKKYEADNKTSSAVLAFEPAKIRIKNFLNTSTAGAGMGMGVTGRLPVPPEEGGQVKTRGASTSVADGGIFEANRPIADLFPETTILFADIAGFTAWSSAREPSQVFTLLETIYGAFDVIAVKRGVFKVETIGDSYVAVTGLPEPRKDHAVAMAKFARDSRTRFAELTHELEKSLGPETADLQFRFGMHSGPVTAGVLRGQKARFQLFGDTVNTASRMESTGQRNRIQVSQATADLLIAANKGHWLKAREEKVSVKGKGEMQTYWVEPASHTGSVLGRSGRYDNASFRGGGSNISTLHLEMSFRSTNHDTDSKLERLVGWNADVMSRLLRQIIARRMQQRGRGRGRQQHGRQHRLRATSNNNPRRKTDRSSLPSLTSTQQPSYSSDAPLEYGQESALPTSAPPAAAEEQRKFQVIDEVIEVIELPCYAENNVPVSAEDVTLDPEVDRQLRAYINTIASTYHRHAFHNFEHASHVGLSVAKLLNRITTPNDTLFDATGQVDGSRNGSFNQDLAHSLHDYTYGITSDPLTQFACVFAALIHDVDHPGVPNTQLVKENDPLARHYHGKSVAEQNSVDIAWKVFLHPDYHSLRMAVCPTDAEMGRFRQLVVNSVMATDILDPDLIRLRNERWEKAFAENKADHPMNHPSQPSGERRPKVEFCNGSNKTNIDRKATIVIEHLIQASDVAHTMQHWHVYRKWNQRLFEEMYVAYQEGRAEKNPADFWYDGEIYFFDKYIIPLAKKLSECGVFGVSSDELLHYALRNREEWERRGKEAVAAMVEAVKTGASRQLS